MGNRFCVFGASVLGLVSFVFSLTSPAQRLGVAETNVFVISSRVGLLLKSLFTVLNAVISQKIDMFVVEL